MNKANQEMTMMYWSLKAVIGFVAFALVMSASTAFADQAYLEFHGGSFDTADSGYVNMIGDEPASTGPGVVLGFEPAAIDGLRLIALYGSDHFNENRFARELTVEWGRQRVMAGADYRLAVIGDRVKPMARLAFGYAYQSLGLEAESREYRDTNHGLIGTAAGGLEATIFDSSQADTGILSHLSFGVNLLFGYSWQTEASFDSMQSQDAPEEPDDDDPWRRADYDAGSMHLHGMTINFGLMMQYQF